MPKKTCFVIGPIGASGSPEREHANTFLKYIVEPCKIFAEFDYATPVRADLIAEPGQITTQIIEHLLHDDLVIADLTGHNPNVFYELSLRHAIGSPVVQMGGIPLPFDVHASRTIPFSFDVREAEKAREDLALQIRQINTPDYQARNLITEAAAVIQIARAGQLDLAAVLRAVQDVAADVRLLAGDVQMLKQRGAAFVSSPTGPTGVSPGNAFISGPSEGRAIRRYPVGPVSVDVFPGDAKLAAAGVGYSVPPGVPPQDPTG
jgi:hypothetical protein